MVLQREVTYMDFESMDFYKRDPSIVEKLPKSVGEAREKGMSKYYTGRKCKNGHDSPRNTVDSSCCECRVIQRDKNTKKRREENKDEEIVPQEGEVFKQHPEYDEFLVSNFGRVYRKRNSYTVKGSLWERRGEMVKQGTSKKGYKTVSRTKKDGTKTSAQVHRLVAQTFIENPDNLPEVNHKDGDKKNNRVKNLEWITTLDNIRHAWDTGLCKAKSGTDHHGSKLTWDDVKLIRAFYEFRHPCWNSKNLAKHLGVNDTTVRNVAHGIIWKEDG
jgi:hypothetical protein